MRGWLGLTLALVAPLNAQSLHYEGSAGLATGTYIFTQRTSSWSVSTGLALSAGPVTLRAYLPVFYQNTTLVASTGSGFLPTGGSSSGTVADSSAERMGRTGSRRLSVVAPLFDVIGSDGGDPVEVPTSATTGYRWSAGDPFVSLSLFGLRGRWGGVTLGGSVKVPVTDTTSFGTGAWDVGGAVSGSAILSSRIMLGVDVGYWYMGDPPDLDLTNPVMFGGTLSILAGRGWGTSIGLSGATPTIAGFAPSVSVTAGLLRLQKTGSLGLLGTVGLTETAPDVSVALSWRVGLLQ